MSSGFQVPVAERMTLFPVDEKDVALQRIPYFMPFEPAAAILANATGQVEQTVSWQDFVATKLGFTSGTVGFPAAPGRWKVQVQDIGGSRNFQPEGWDVAAAIGVNSGVSDTQPIDLPVPWVFLEKTTIRATFEEIAGFANTPHLVLIGFLTNWRREAASAQARQQLELIALQNSAGQGQWQR